MNRYRYSKHFKALHVTLIPLLILVGFLGCQEGSQNSKPYLYGTNTTTKKIVPYNNALDAKRELAQIEAKSHEEIARINMQKEIEVQRLKNDAELHKTQIQTDGTLQKAHIDKDVALSAQELSKALQESQSVMQKWWLIGALVGLVFILFFIYLMKQKRNALQLKLQNEKLEYERQLKEQEMRMNMATKILDTLASGQVSQEHQDRLLNALEQKSDDKLPHKKD
jgi:hypothetical protein